MVPLVTRCVCMVSVLAMLGVAGPVGAIAQDLGPLPNFLPPPPPPTPPPPIYVPEVPKLGQVQQPRNVRPSARRPSYGDRVARCLDDAAAAGLSPNERTDYARRCAN